MSESPDVNLVTQQLSKSQVRGRPRPWGHLGPGQRKMGSGVVPIPQKLSSRWGFVSEHVPLLTEGA